MKQSGCLEWWKVKDFKSVVAGRDVIGDMLT